MTYRIFELPKVCCTLQIMTIMLLCNAPGTENFFGLILLNGKILEVEMRQEIARIENRQKKTLY